jgi:hypothetical protein
MEHPAYPRWLKIGAASAMIRCLVASPLVIPIASHSTAYRKKDASVAFLHSSDE